MKFPNRTQARSGCWRFVLLGYNPDMQQEQTGIDAYMAFLVRWRWQLLVATLSLAAVLSWGLQFMTINDSFRALFSKDNPQYRAYENMEKEYIQLDYVLLTLAPHDGNVFTNSTLSAVHDLTEKAWKFPYVQRVDSVTNYQRSKADGDDIIVSELVANPESATPEELSDIRRTALAETDLVNRIISKDGDVTGIYLIVLLPENTRGGRDQVMACAENAADEIRNAYPGIDVYVSGLLAMNVAFKEVSLRDLKTLTPLMYLVVVLMVFLLLRSIVATLVTVLIIALSVSTGMGLAGWLGLKLTSASAAAPTLILTLAVADSVHILMSMLRRMWEGADQQTALLHGMRVNLNPVFLTSLTTVIGFLSMNFADSPPLHDVGNISAMGVAAAFVYTVVLLPILLSFVAIRTKPRRVHLVRFMERLGEFVVAQRRVLLAVAIVAVGLLAATVPLNEVNDRWLEYFDRSVPFRQAGEFVNDRLTGFDVIMYSLQSGEPGGVTSPEYLRTVDAFTQWLRAHPEVAYAGSLTDTLKRLNMNMHGGDRALYRLPENQELVAQYLLVYEMSLPPGLGLDAQLNGDRSAVRVTAIVKNIPSNQLRRLSEAGTQWLRDNAPAHMVCEGVGPSIMFAHLAERNLRGMVHGTAVAFLLVTAVLMLAFRNLKYALISLVPNVAPAVCAFGIWGLCVGYVGFAVWTVAAMSLGLVVDDTIHFLNKYAFARRDLGQSASAAVCFAFNTVGAALVVTSVILATGFLVISLSTFKVNSDVGLLTAIIISCALVTDMLLLPPLLLWLDTDV